MCFNFKKNNKQSKKPVNCFLQDDASAGIQSLQTSIEIKLCQNPWNGLYWYHYDNINEQVFKLTTSLFIIIFPLIIYERVFIVSWGRGKGVQAQTKKNMCKIFSLKVLCLKR